LKPIKGTCKKINGYQKEIKGFKMKKVPRKGYLKEKASLYRGAHRNGFNDTISHEVSPTHTTITLTLEGFFLSLFPLGPIPLPRSFISLSWLAHLIGLNEGPPIFKLSN
jgi:hypothetical protein